MLGQINVAKFKIHFITAHFSLEKESRTAINNNV